MKKKVTFVITKSNWGGAQRYVFDLAVSLPKEEFDVGVAFGQTGLLATKLQEANINTFPLHTLERDVSFRNDVRTFNELLHLFRQKRPDVVHLNSSKAAGIVALAARIAGVKKIIFTVHGWPFLEPRNSISCGLIYFLSWLTAVLSHVVIVVSNHDLRIAQKMPFVGKKTVRIYNGIDSNFTEKLQSGNYIRDHFPTGVHITGTIGELNKNKNHIALIEQAKNNPTMYVAICGDGEQRQFLQHTIEAYDLNKRVKLFGFVEPKTVLKGFDTFALPSLKEGLPYVLLEAKAAGLPIVANRVGGVGEILDAQDMHEFSLKRMVEETKKLY